MKAMLVLVAVDSCVRKCTSPPDAFCVFVMVAAAIFLSIYVSIYTGEYMIFAVDSPGEIWAWGLNQNNCLLTNQPEMGLVNTIVEQPMKVNLPDYFL